MARIEFADADGRPQRFEIPETGTGTVIGRSPSSNCLIPNHSVGRNHGRIAFEAGQFTYTDLGSVNGSYLNDRKLTGAQPLADGDVILLGEVEVRFVLESRRPTGSVRSGDADGRTMVEHEIVPSPEPPPPAPVVASPALQDVAARPTLAASVVTDDARSRADAVVAALAQRDQEVIHLRGLLADGDRRCKDAESRATVATSSLESMHAKYLDMRDQVSHLQNQIDRVRSEGSDSQIEASELREKVASLNGQVEAIRGRSGQNAEEIGNLKVKLTDRDREIERLRRDSDGREYDMKALREENDRLQEFCHSDTGRQQELERKSRNLEAVIDENRNLIASLRRDVEKKDDELRKVRLGGGIADLEQEKTRLLEDYHRKNRELDEQRTNMAGLQAEMGVLCAEKEGLAARVHDLEEASRARLSEREDISDHPEYRARTREVETLGATVVSLTAELDRRPVVAPQPVIVSPAPDLIAGLSGVGDALLALADGLLVLQATIKDAAAVIEALDQCDVPAGVRAALGGTSPGEMAESIRDVRRMISEDLDALRAAWEAGRSLWQPAS